MLGRVRRRRLGSNQPQARRRHLQRGVPMPDERPLFAAANLRLRRLTAYRFSQMVSHRVEVRLHLNSSPFKQTGSKLAPGRVRPLSGTDQQMGVH
jgi:hypothetical protein